MATLVFGNLTIPPARSVNGAAAGAADRQLAVAGSRTVVPLTYGEDRIGARILNVLPAGSGSTTLLVQCLWGFAGDSVLDVRLNDQALPPGATVTTYTGSQTTADSSLVSAFAAQSITYADTLNGYSYSVVALPMRSVEGSLSISARVRGRRLYDPRKDSTVSGGAGVHRLNNAATWEWSDCPALADADFLANATYGCGRTVDWVSVIAAANANDALVGTPSEKRRTLGVSLVQAAPVAQIADALRAYAGCWHVPGPQGVRLVPDVDASPVATYSHDAGGILSIDALMLRDIGDAPTAVEVLYTDTRAFPWREGSAIATLSGAGTTLPWRLSQVRLPGIQRYSQALREATERLNKLALQGIATAVEVFDGGIAIEEGDIIALTHPVGLSARPFRVVAPAMVSPGRWRLALVEHSAAAYSTSVVAAPSLGGPALANPVGAPAAVAGLAGTVGQGIITWTWTEPTEQDAQVRLRQGGTDWASASPVWSGRATSYLQRVTATGSYTLRARLAVPDGLGGWVESTSTSSTTLNVVAGDLVQSEPGAPGLSQAMAELYQWGSSSQPGNPSGTSVWTWSTAGHASYTGGNGWGTAVGTNPGTAGSRLWVARKAVSAAVGASTTSVDWTGGYTIFAAGVNGAQGPTGNTGGAGAAGIKAATPTVWRWASSVPTISGTATYTWAAADVGLVPSGWSATPGTGSPGQTLYGASVQLVDAAGASTTAIDWSTASVSARGYAGTNGGTGPQGAAGVSARRAYVLTGAASLGSGSVTTTGSNSLPPDGSYGANGWQAQPGTPATGQALYQSDGLYDPTTNQVTWSTPYISALKVGNLAALAVNTGSLTVDGALVVGAGGGAYSSNYVAGSSGWALLPSGAQLPAASILGTLSIGQVPAGARNDQITVAGGLLAGIGTAGVQVDNTYVPLGGNMIPNSDAGSGYAAPWGVTWVQDGGSDYSFGVNLGGAGMIPQGGQCLTLVRFGNARTGLIDFRTVKIPVVAGARYEFSAYVASHRCDTWLNVVWSDTAGGYLGEVANPSTRVSGGTKLADFHRNGFFVAAPAGAAAAIVGLRVSPTDAGQSDSYAFGTRFLFSEANASQAQLSAWSPASITGANQLGYTGDLNATNGAPAGTPVAGVDASTVRDNAAAGATANAAIPGINSALSARLQKAGDSITGRISLTVSDALFAGTNLDNGVYLGSGGLVGRKAGATTFSISTAGDALFGGELAAATGTLGALTIASGGHIKQGQTAYATGTGFWLGDDGGSPKLSVGNATQYLRWSPSAGLQLSIDSEAIVVASGPRALLGSLSVRATRVQQTGSVTHTAIVELRRDGTIWTHRTVTGSSTVSSQVGSWYLAGVSTIGDDYDVRFDVTNSQEGLTGFTNAASDWTQISATRAVTLTRTTTNFLDQTVSGSVSVRRRSNSTPVCSGTWAVTVTREI